MELLARAGINQLRGILENTKKRSPKMSEYLANMKQASNNLQLAGVLVPFDGLMSYVVAGLDSEYIVIVCTI